MASNAHLQVFLLTQVEMSRPSETVSALPESLLPVANRELLDLQLESLENCGFQKVTLVCPTSVVESLRSWKSDVCKRKIAVTFYPFEDSLDTAEVLYLFKDSIKDDFVVIVGSVLFDSAAILNALALHRAEEPVVTCVMQPKSDRNTVSQSLKKSVSDVQDSTTFVGYAEGGRLLYMRSNWSIVASLNSSNITIKKSILKRFPDMRISTQFFDSQIYVFSKHALPLAEEKRRNLTSIRQHLVPFLVRAQFHKHEPHASVQDLAYSMSSSPLSLGPELRCHMYVAPPEVFLSRIESLEDFVLVSRLVAGEAVPSMLPPGERSVVKRVVLYKEPGVTEHEKAMIGTGCILGEGSVIEGPCSVKKSTLGKHTRVFPNTKIQTSILLDHVTISEGAVVKNSIIGSNVIIDTDCVVENAIIGKGMKTEKGKKYSDETFS